MDKKQCEHCAGNAGALSNELASPLLVNFEKLLTSSFLKLREDNMIEQCITDYMRKAMVEVISTFFNYNSDFRKSFETTLKKNCRINFKEISLPEYNTLMITTIESMLRDNLASAGIERVKIIASEMLSSNIPAEIPLSNLVRLFATNNDFLDERPDRISFFYKKDSHLCWIYLDRESGKRQDYECDTKITLNSDLTISGYRTNEHDFKSTKSVGNRYGFEKLLFQFYSAGTKIILDTENVETSFSWDDDD